MHVFNQNVYSSLSLYNVLVLFGGSNGGDPEKDAGESLRSAKSEPGVVVGLVQQANEYGGFAVGRVWGDSSRRADEDTQAFEARRRYDHASSI